MKTAAVVVGAALGSLLLGGALVLALHPDWIQSDPGGDEEEAAVETVVPVHVAKVERATVHRYVEGFGNVLPDPAHDGLAAAGARVASPLEGVLARAACAEGEHVDKGQVLFELDGRMAAAEEQKAAASQGAAKATLARLESAVAFQERELARTREMSAEQLASARDLAEAELQLESAKSELSEAKAKVNEAAQVLSATRTERGLLRIVSPLAGTVVHVMVRPGEAIEKATVLAEIVDLARLDVVASVPASEVRWLKVGQPAELSVGGSEHQGEPTRATVSFIGFDVDPKTDTAVVRAALLPDAGLRPGQYVRLRIAVEERANVLVVPIGSVVSGEGDQRVVALVSGDRATQTPVEVGVREGSRVEVSGQGIEQGAIVVTAGAYGLPKETRVRVLAE